MYRHFLVAAGGTDAAIAAIGHALEFARSVGARVTFFPACNACDQDGDEAAARNRVMECFVKAEAAARAQGVPCATISRARTDSGAPTLLTFADAARVHGCDLVCASPDTPWMDYGAAAGEPFVPCAIPVLMCAAPRHESADLAVGALLAGHRAICAQLHVLLDHTRTAISRGAPLDATALRSLVLALGAVPALRHRPGVEECLFPRLRERTSTLDAELAELERQHQHEIRLVDELVDNADAVAEGSLSLELFEQRLQACARFIWERMGREEGVILPAARRYLSDADWQDMCVALSLRGHT